MTEYYIGQIFDEMYPKEASDWCGDNNAYITEIEPLDNVRRFEIKECKPPQPIDVDTLTMTPLDFIKCLQYLGLSLEQINNFLDNNLEIKMQLTYCNNVYCGVAKSFVPITIEGITITKEMIEQIFISKYEVE